MNPEPISTKTLESCRCKCSKESTHPYGSSRRTPFVSTGVKTDTLAYVVNKTPNLKRLIIANEAQVETLPEILLNRNVSMLLSSVVQALTLALSKDRTANRSGREAADQFWIGLLVALKDTSSTVRVGNRMVEAGPLFKGFAAYKWQTIGLRYVWWSLQGLNRYAIKYQRSPLWKNVFTPSNASYRENEPTALSICPSHILSEQCNWEKDE